MKCAPLSIETTVGSPRPLLVGFGFRRPTRSVYDGRRRRVADPGKRRLQPVPLQKREPGRVVPRHHTRPDVVASMAVSLCPAADPPPSAASTFDQTTRTRLGAERPAAPVRPRRVEPRTRALRHPVGMQMLSHHLLQRRSRARRRRPARHGRSRNHGHHENTTHLHPSNARRRRPRCARSLAPRPTGVKRGWRRITLFVDRPPPAHRRFCLPAGQHSRPLPSRSCPAGRVARASSRAFFVFSRSRGPRDGRF